MATPALDLLLGPEAPGVLAVALAEYGGRLDGLNPVNVHVRPTGAAVVRYHAAVQRADGRRTPEILVATTGDRIPPGATIVAGEHRDEPVEVGIWRWPHDPALPGLQTVSDPARTAADFGDHVLGAATALCMKVRAYRPGNRAVVEVYDGRQRWFVKVVRPAAAAGLRARHDLLCRHVPVPPVLLSTPDGVIVLPEAPGTPVRTLIGADAALPTPQTLEALLDDLPADLATMAPKRTQVERAADSAAVLRHTAADHPELLSDLSRVAEPLLSSRPEPQTPVPVHGDFYEGQLFADDGRVTGLLDVDTAGPGERADDWATFIGHLSVAGLAAPAARRYCAAVLDHARGGVDPADLRRRVAAVVLGLATGPFRTQHPRWPEVTAERLELARNWLVGAR